MISEKLFNRFYSDIKYNGTLIFYDWIRANINKETLLLNLGAGPTALKKVYTFKGEVKKVTGADIDEEVLKNTDLDEAFIIRDDKLPFSDNMFDCIISDYVLEHVEKPEMFLSEVYRVLKPGGSYFFRTPNKYHYVTLFSRLTPHWVHTAIANKIRGLSEEAYEPYKTHYRMNTKGKLEKLSSKTGFNRSEFKMIEGEPMYLKFNIAPFLLGVAYERTVNRFNSLSFLRVNILGRLSK